MGEGLEIGIMGVEMWQHQAKGGDSWVWVFRGAVGFISTEHSQLVMLTCGSLLGTWSPQTLAGLTSSCGPFQGFPEWELLSPSLPGTHRLAQIG